MVDLMKYAADLAASDNAGKLPPVERWNPDYCGALDLVIRRDGTWVHEGTPIGRARLVRLFSTVLRRDDDAYFLVTPVEKLGIIVEDVPFLAVLYETVESPVGQMLRFTTNVGDHVLLDDAAKFTVRPIAGTSQMAPYVTVRAGLEARLARSVYYDLANAASLDDDGTLFVMSGGQRFCFGTFDDTAIEE